MWNMTELAFIKAVDSPETRVEVIVLGRPATRKGTILKTIRNLLEKDGFTVRINEEAIPGVAAKLEAVRGRIIKPFP